jgi:hypothetical protein
MELFNMKRVNDAAMVIEKEVESLLVGESIEGIDKVLAGFGAGNLIRKSHAVDYDNLRVGETKLAVQIALARLSLRAAKEIGELRHDPD